MSVIQGEGGHMSSFQLRVKEELLTLLDLGAAALEAVVQGYAARRSRERDLTWLALQAGKEYGAVTLHARRNLDCLPPKSPGEIRKAIEDALEEVDHYAGYMSVLEWALGGEPCPVQDMYRYCGVAPYRLLGYGDYEETKQRWPANYAYFMERQEHFDRCSAWGNAVLAACGEGGAVGWHYAMSRIPVTDEFSRRVVKVEQAVVDDELHHGPELLERLARETPSEAEYEDVKRRVRRIRSLELWQRNEQFQHPLSDEELNVINDAMRAGRLEPLSVFHQALG